MTIPMKFTCSAALLSASLGAIACAGAPPPTDRMAAAEAETRAAQAVGAERVPQANLAYKLANDEFAKGRALMKDGDNEAADRMFRRAKVDAELAMALAREEAARADAAQASQGSSTQPSPDVSPPASPGGNTPPPAATPEVPNQ